MQQHSMHIDGEIHHVTENNSVNKIVQTRLYMVLWQPTAMLSLCWQCQRPTKYRQRPRRYHQSLGQVEEESIQTASRLNRLAITNTVDRPFCRLSWMMGRKILCYKLAFIEEICTRSLPDRLCLPCQRLLGEHRHFCLGFVWDAH